MVRIMVGSFLNFRFNFSGSDAEAQYIHTLDGTNLYGVLLYVTANTFVISDDKSNVRRSECKST